MDDPFPIVVQHIPAWNAGKNEKAGCLDFYS